MALFILTHKDTRNKDKMKGRKNISKNEKKILAVSPCEALIAPGCYEEQFIRLVSSKHQICAEHNKMRSMHVLLMPYRGVYTV
jgi:hypothetical protein